MSLLYYRIKHARNKKRNLTVKVLDLAEKIEKRKR